MIDEQALRDLVQRWRGDPGGTYQSWFLWADRLKNFGSIRRGITEEVAEIDAGTFGSAYKGSSLETVVGAVAEQRQLFKGITPSCGSPSCASRTSTRTGTTRSPSHASSTRVPAVTARSGCSPPSVRSTPAS